MKLLQQPIILVRDVTVSAYKPTVCFHILSKFLKVTDPHLQFISHLKAYVYIYSGLSSSVRISHYLKHTYYHI